MAVMRLAVDVTGDGVGGYWLQGFRVSVAARDKAVTTCNFAVVSFIPTASQPKMESVVISTQNDMLISLQML